MHVCHLHHRDHHLRCMVAPVRQTAPTRGDAAPEMQLITTRGFLGIGIVSLSPLPSYIPSSHSTYRTLSATHGLVVHLEMLSADTLLHCSPPTRSQ